MAKYDFTKPSELYKNRTYINKKGETAYVNDVEDNGLGVTFVKFIDAFANPSEQKTYTMPARIFCKEFQLLFDLPEILGKTEDSYEILNSGQTLQGELITVWTILLGEKHIAISFTKKEFLDALQRRSEVFAPKTKKKEKKEKEENVN